MRTRRAAALAASICVVLAAGAPSRAATGDEAARRGAAWIAARQAQDGGFFDPGAPAEATADAIAAVVAGGLRGPVVGRALGGLARTGAERARVRGAYAGRIVAGVVAGGADPRAHGGADLVAILRGHYDPITGAYDADGIFADAQAALGVLAAGEALPERAITYLRASQCAGGGFGFRAGCVGGADVDTTALVAMVLAGAGLRADDATKRVRGYLLDAMNGERGFGFTAGTGTNANSTGLALSAIAALGDDPRARPWARAGRDPLGALLALQLRSGGFRWTRDDRSANAYATVQAVPGAAGEAYPVPPPGAPPDVATRSEVPTAVAADRSRRRPGGSQRRADPPDARPAPRDRAPAAVAQQPPSRDASGAPIWIGAVALAAAAATFAARARRRPTLGRAA